MIRVGASAAPGAARSRARRGRSDRSTRCHRCSPHRRALGRDRSSRPADSASWCLGSPSIGGGTWRESASGASRRCASTASPERGPAVGTRRRRYSPARAAVAESGSSPVVAAQVSGAGLAAGLVAGAAERQAPTASSAARRAPVARMTVARITRVRIIAGSPAAPDPHRPPGESAPAARHSVSAMAGRRPNARRPGASVYGSASARFTE